MPRHLLPRRLDRSHRSDTGHRNHRVYGRLSRLLEARVGFTDRNLPSDRISGLPRSISASIVNNVLSIDRIEFDGRLEGPLVAASSKPTIPAVQQSYLTYPKSWRVIQTEFMDIVGTAVPTCGFVRQTLRVREHARSCCIRDAVFQNTERGLPCTRQ